MTETDMPIRTATYKDAPAIRTLLDALGYKTSISMVIGQLERSFGGTDHQVFVYVKDNEVIGFISVHFLPQLGFEGELMVISYLSVEQPVKSPDIKSALEHYVSQLAINRKCDRVQVHCLDWRVPEHQFYKQHGYQEYPNYFTKRLVT
jgi:GNAT superfamily N-acetyltransferase